jgi:hypothetical protein
MCSSLSIENLQFQQNPDTLSIAVIVLEAKSNRLSDLQALIPRILTALTKAPAGVITIR